MERLLRYKRIRSYQYHLFCDVGQWIRNFETGWTSLFRYYQLSILHKLQHVRRVTALFSSLLCTPPSHRQPIYSDCNFCAAAFPPALSVRYRRNAAAEERRILPTDHLLPPSLPPSLEFPFWVIASLSLQIAKKVDPRMGTRKYHNLL